MPKCAKCRARKATAAPPPASRSPCAFACRATPNAHIRFTDSVYGEQSKATADIEDFALLRSDGLPTYHMASCADDADLQISHIIRGQDHLTNTFKHVLIFEAAGVAPPQFAHLPLLVAPDGAKLSKRRHGPVVSVTTYRDAGFLPHAFVNFLCLVGWSPKDDRELLTRQELIDAFSLEGIHRHNAVVNFKEDDPFDPKAVWLNAEMIRAMPLGRTLRTHRAVRARRRRSKRGMMPKSPRLSANASACSATFSPSAIFSSPPSCRPTISPNSSPKKATPPWRCGLSSAPATSCPASSSPTTRWRPPCATPPTNRHQNRPVVPAHPRGRVRPQDRAAAVWNPGSALGKETSLARIGQAIEKLKSS